MQGSYVILLDDNMGFETPITVEVSGNSHVFGEEFDFGTYYWKVESWPFSSEIRRFTLGSSVVVSRTENNVKNEGNVGLLLHSMTGAFVVGVNESIEIGAEEDVKAEQV
jgi:hypothetical protein